MKLREHQEEILSNTRKNTKGIIISPTGSGKTICMAEDAKRFLLPGNVILVVSPRLMLGQQLFIEFDTYLHDHDFAHREVSSQSPILHRARKKVEVQPEKPTTFPSEIYETYEIAKKHNLPLILFSTYDSLDRVISSGIPITVAYFDESHNAVKGGYFDTVKETSKKSSNSFFFTATPRYTQSGSSNGAGMNNTSVYGEIIATVSFKYLVEKGYIVRPLLHRQKSNACIKNAHPEQVDFQTVTENVLHYEENFLDTHAHKILYCMKGTKNIKDLLTKTKLQQWASEKGYHVLSIDSQNDGYVDGKIMSKEKFMDKLKELGSDHNAKLLVFHYEMIAEGIDVKGFTGVCFMRPTTNTTFITQTIGRCIRAAGEWKKYGIVTVVEHEDDTSEVSELAKQIVVSLLDNGVPLDSILNETTGRGESEETIESLDQSIKRQLKEIEMEWTHDNLLEEYRTKSVDQLMSELVPV
jgi:superfamily II DNA or RNA helicase